MTGRAVTISKWGIDMPTQVHGGYEYNQQADGSWARGRPVSVAQPIGEPNPAIRQADERIDIARQSAANVEADRASRRRMAEEAASRADRADARAEASARRSSVAAERGTVEQQRAGGFLRRAINAERNFGNVRIEPRSSVGQSIYERIPNLTNEFWNSEDRQLVDQAEREFVMAILRYDSGAAIPDPEIFRAADTYFPRPGNTPAVIRQKEESRRAAIEGLIGASGPVGSRLAVELDWNPDQEGNRDQEGADSNPLSVGPGNNQTPWNGGGAGGPGPLQNAEGEAYSTPQDMAVAAAMQDVYNRGGSVQDMIRVARENNYPIDLQQTTEWQRAVDYRDSQGEYEGQPGGFSRVATPMSGRRGLISQTWGDVASSPLGAAGIAMADQWAMGGLDEITGGINSAIRGSDYDSEATYANMGKQAVAEENPWSSLGGSLAGGLSQGFGAARALPKLAGALTATPGRIAATGAGYGAVNGALEANDNRAVGAGIGGLTGGLGGLFGSYVAAPVTDAAARNVTDWLSSRAGRELLPRPTVADRTLRLDEQAMEAARARLAQASELNVPMSLADTSPEMRALAGSVSRRSTDARALAENTFEQRGRDQADRARSLVNDQLAPITDIAARGQQWKDAANTEAGPLYAQMRSQRAPVDDDALASLINTPAGRAALRDAREIAANEGRNPDELGFVMDETGGVTLSQSDRFMQEAQPPSHRSLVSGFGNRAPKDLVTFIREMGGLRDQGGELSHMGFTNRSRRGVPFAGNDQKAGPLVNPNGMTYEEAIEAASEAGYFGGQTYGELPSINDFLSALRGTHDGYDRKFAINDMPTVDEYFSRQGARMEFDRDGPKWIDTSSPAGDERLFAPLAAYGSEGPVAPTWETLDYVKRGIDRQLEGFRNPLTGQLNLEGDPLAQSVDGLRRRFVSRLDELNPDYSAARSAYQGQIRNRDALNRGFDAAQPRIHARDLNPMTSGMDDTARGEFQRGYASRLGDQIDDTNLGRNPFDRIFGTTSAQEKMAQVFPDGAANIRSVYDMEREMAATARETIGGSPTASRLAADDRFDSGIATGIDMGTQMATGGGFSPSQMIRMGGQIAGDRLRLGFGQERANAIAPVLFNTNPDEVLGQLGQTAARMEWDRNRRDAFKRVGGLFGAVLPVSGTLGTGLP